MLTDEEIYEQGYEFYSSLHTKHLSYADVGIKCFTEGANFAKDHYEKEIVKIDNELKWSKAHYESILSNSASYLSLSIFTIARYESILSKKDKELAEKDKQIEELKSQIEKMKCCENCDHLIYDDELEQFKCRIFNHKIGCGSLLDYCYDDNHWELKV